MALQAASVGLPSVALAVATLAADKIWGEGSKIIMATEKSAFRGRQIARILRETDEPG